MPNSSKNSSSSGRPRGGWCGIKDIGRVELGARNEDFDVMFDGQPTVLLVVFQLPEANALETHDRVVAKMRRAECRTFPTAWAARLASTRLPTRARASTRCSRRSATRSCWWRIVVLVFLQNWRSAIIPLLAVPVAIVGTFAAMALFGFSLNNLTLFGLVLAIGIVVDDAIVVVEAVEHHIEEGTAPRAATVLAMRQVSGPVVAVARCSAPCSCRALSSAASRANSFGSLR